MISSKLGKSQMARRHGRIDANQNEIVDALRKSNLAVSVAVTSGLGNGFGDLVIGFGGGNYIIEIKDGSKSPSKRKLTTAEADFHRDWLGQIDVAKNLDEVLEIIGAI